MKEPKRRLLLELKDISPPLSEVAKRVGISRQTAAKKIEELRKKGLSTVRVDPSKLGLKTKGHVFINEDPHQGVRKRNERIIRGIPQVSEFHRIFDRHSTMMKNPEELKKVVNRIHGLEGVRKTETFIVHSTIKDDPHAPLVHLLEEEGGE